MQKRILVNVIVLSVASLNGCGPRTPTPTATIVVTDSPLLLASTRSPINGVAKTLTITNTSATTPALAVVADLTGALATGGVTVTSTTCASIAPGASCTISFTAGIPEVFLTSFPIKGSNTNTVTAELRVLSYGSDYQGGYIFDLNSTATEGKV